MSIGSAQCIHNDFDVQVSVERIVDSDKSIPQHFRLFIRAVKCRNCGLPFFMEDHQAQIAGFKVGGPTIQAPLPQGPVATEPINYGGKS